MGFIARSAEVRNAFEFYGPFLRLCKRILGPNTKLILSTRWGYAPATYIAPEYLPGFVVIGLPAPEASNPLLLPLGGHELGHTIWEARGFKGKYKGQIRERIMNAVRSNIAAYMAVFPKHGVKEDQTLVELAENSSVTSTINRAVELGINQAREYFCDFCGVFLFGPAFLDANAYFLPPGTERRSPDYPNIRQRADRLVEAANKYEEMYPSCYTLTVDYREMFEDCIDTIDVEGTYLTSLADVASGALAATLMDSAASILSDATVPQISPAKVREIVNAYRYIVPAEHAESVVNIVNAAWDVYRTEAFWPDLPADRSKRAVLSELVFKTFEVLESEELRRT
jgi:hypothetical protein